MKKFICVLMVLLTTIASSAQNLTRDQLQDSIFIMLSKSSYTNNIKSIRRSYKSLKDVNGAKLDCAMEKLFGLNEWSRNKMSQNLQGLSDSDLQKFYDYTKLSSRMNSSEFTSALQSDLGLLTLNNMTKLMAKGKGGKMDDLNSLMKIDKFIINDKEVQAYVDIILEIVNNADDIASSLVESASGQSLDESTKKMMGGLIKSSIEVTTELLKKYLLVFYTKQELKQMSEIMSRENSFRSLMSTNILHDEGFKQKLSEMVSKLSTVNWEEEVAKVTDAEVAVHAQKFLSFEPHANPVPREKTTLTIDGGQYTGEVWNGEANGVGKFIDAKGNTYTGDFLANKMDGYGVMVTAKGKTSKGYWKQGKYLGEEPKDTDYGYHITNNNGLTESGIFKRGKLSGKGTMSYAGSKIQGLFEEGKMTDGIFENHSDGVDIIGKGSFDVMCSGTGVLQITTDNGVIQRSGHFVDVSQTGYGLAIIKAKNGNTNTLRGLFIDGDLVGKGHVISTEKSNDGVIFASHYNGYFFNRAKNGEGTDTIVNSNGFKRIHQGIFKDGKLINGKIILPKDSLVYEGEVKDNNYHGQGTLTFSNGTKYSGKWNNGILHGKGIVSYSDGTTIEGTFISGRCSDGVQKDKNGKVLQKNVIFSMLKKDE